MTDYLVRFSLTVPADNASDAVDSVIDLFVEKGLRDWVYRVDDPTAAPGTDSLIGFFDGYGDPVDVEALLAEGESQAPATPEQVDAVTSELPVADETSDAELEALAESLNQDHEEPTPSIEDQALASVREHSTTE